MIKLDLHLYEFLNPLSIAFCSIAITATALARSILRGNRSKLTRGWVLLLSSPGLIALGTFYSLATRMHSALGGWPETIGIGEVPLELHLHSDVMGWAFTAALLIAACIPIALILFYAVPRLRPHMIYPAFLGSASWLCIFATQLAPSGFLNWFWD